MPGFSRAMIVSQRLVRLCRSSQVGVICAFIITGTITSGLSPTTMPEKPAGGDADDGHRQAVERDGAVEHATDRRRSAASSRRG